MRVVRDVWEKFYNQGDVSVFFGNASDDYVWKSDTLFPFPGTVTDKVEAARLTAKLGKLLPGVYGKILSLVAGGDTVTLISHTSVHRSDGYLGLPAIDRPFNFHQCLFNVLNEEGKIREQTFFYDRVHILQQLGVLPEVSVFGGPGGEQWPYYVYPAHLYPDRGLSAKSDALHESPDLAQMVKKILEFPIRIISRGLSVDG